MNKLENLYIHAISFVCIFICSLKDCLTLKVLSQRVHGISLFFKWDSRCFPSLFLEPKILSQYSHSRASLCSFLLWELSEICVDNWLPHSSHWNFFSPVLWWFSVGICKYKPGWLVLLSLYIFWGKCVYFSIFEW